MREPQFLTRSEPSSLESSFEEGKRNFPFPFFFFFLTRHSDVCACILPVKIFEDRANLNLIHAGILREIIVSRKENRKTRFSKLFSIFPVNENHLFSLHLSLYVDFSKNVPYFFFFFYPRMHCIRVTRRIYKNSNIEYLRSKLETTTTTTW